VVSLFAGVRGFLDDLDVSVVRRFETGLLEDVRSRYSGMLADIRGGGALPEADLSKAVTSFKERFLAAEKAPKAQKAPQSQTEKPEG
jgi:F-type H+/Na+-transporting ATPase subunit alpha